MNFYQKITNTGISNQKNIPLLKELKLLNSYVIIMLHITFFFVSIDFYAINYVNYLEFYAHATSLLLMISILVLNKHGFIKITRIIWVIYIFLLICYATFVIDFSIYSACFLGLVPLVVMSLYKKNRNAYICLIISVLTFRISVFYSVTNSSDIIKLNDPIPYAFFFTLFFLFSYFKKRNLNNENLLELQRDKALKDKIRLEKQEAKLRELNEFKSHFFVNLSHEIRTPLTLIQGYTNQINLKGSEEINTNKLNIVKAQCKQMQDIINSIMDLSKIESSELQITPRHINLHTFLEKHFADFQGLFTKKNIVFQLKNQVKNTTILIDQDLFSKAVNNLLSNALKFTSTGGLVSINANFINNQLILEIKDNGIGIPADEIEFVYKRFYQVKNDITKSQGSGIGLAFTKSIVNAHHFSITLKSTYTKGTSFSILIPMEYTNFHDHTLSKKEATLSKTTDATLLPNKEILKDLQNILLVDDHEPMRLYLKDVLKDYTITQAENGEEALKILKENNNFDLIITDYMMPVMDGEEFVKQLKQKQNKTPVIVLTARTDNHGKLSMLRLGIDGYLHKPFMEEELLINVRNSLKLNKNIKEFDKNNSIKEIKSLNVNADKFQAKITTYINQNIASNLLTLDNIADYMNISRSTLNRKTKSLLGQTVNQLIIEVRLAKARTLILENPLTSKKEIAQAVGVSSTTHLFKSLKERYGI